MEMLKLDEYAVRMGLHPNTVHKMLREGRLIGQKAGKSWRIADDAVPMEKGERVEEKPVEVARVVEVKVEQVAQQGNPVVESYNRLRELADSGDITYEQATRLAKMAEDLRKARSDDSKVLAKEWGKLAIQERELNVREAGLEARDKELATKNKLFSESWDNDSAVLDDMKAEFEESKKRLADWGDIHDALLRDRQQVKDYYLKAREQYPKLQDILEPVFELPPDWYNQLDDGKDGASDDIDQGVAMKPKKKHKSRAKKVEVVEQDSGLFAEDDEQG